MEPLKSYKTYWETPTCPKISRNKKWNASFFTFYICAFFLVQQPKVGKGLFIYEISRSHKTAQHSRQDSSGRVISSSQPRPLPDKTQHSQQTDIHVPGGIRTHNLRRRATADVRLSPNGQLGRLYVRYKWGGIKG